MPTTGCRLDACIISHHHGCINKAAARQAPMFMILDESAAGRRKQREIKNKGHRVGKVSSMKYDALSFICIDSKCLN